jgi:Holliday junction resolvasome RuvABC endonuclease subunit
VIILGCDLSYTRSGLVWLNSFDMVVEDHCTVTLPISSGRLLLAVKQFHRVLECNTPDLAVIEAPLQIRSSDTERMLQELQAIMKLTLQAHHIPCVEPQPRPGTIKQLIAGSGNASKCDVADVLRLAFDISFEDDACPRCKNGVGNSDGHDLSDAAACAVWAAVMYSYAW